VYRPQCEGCRACVPVRVPVERFRPDRRQRRCLRANADLEITERGPEFDPEHFALFERYLAARHAGGGMDQPTREDYLGFIRADWSDTLLYEFRLKDRLLAVAVVDRLPDALSAVYTFFEPAGSRRGLGRHAVLSEIRLAREAHLKWLYLGYWISGCAKMRYKNEYRPLEYLGPGGWSETPPA
ncbi:MAG: arginyltransferase, partial [Gammaproteobacteria bacterium]